MPQRVKGEEGQLCQEQAWGWGRGGGGVGTPSRAHKFDAVSFLGYLVLISHVHPPLVLTAILATHNKTTASRPTCSKSLRPSPRALPRIRPSRTWCITRWSVCCFPPPPPLSFSVVKKGRHALRRERRRRSPLRE
jgi:hypothetical protein